MAIGHDTLIVEETCDRVAGLTPCAIAPSFDYGPTGYALGGPADGTIDPDYDAFGRHVKSILRNFIEMGFRKTYVIVMHQGMGGPLALSFSKAGGRACIRAGSHRWPQARLGGETRKHWPGLGPAAGASRFNR